jgi:LacI family transcriptional regulator
VSDRARIRDVAERAGVSVGTVSNVLNRPDLVAVGTRQRVEEAVESLRYVRNEPARLLRSGQSRTVGLIVPDVANPFFTDVARGVEDVTSAAGILVIVCNSDSGVDKEARYLRMLAEHQVLGVLDVPAGPSAAVRQLRDRDVPVVLLDYTGPARGRCSVSVNDIGGGQLAISHLLSTGHRRVSFVGHGSGPARQVADRLAGARAAMAAAGRDPDDLELLPTSSLTVQGGIEAARALLSLPRRRRPTGVACANDLLAIGMLQEVLRSGARVPQDVAIVGYDDIAFAAAAAIPLTSVRQPRNLLGRRGAELLLDEATNAQHRHTNVVFEPELIVRASTDSHQTSRDGSRSFS